jgi:glutathione peroxidase
VNYLQLSQLYDEYAAQGLKILAFPCNQFGFRETRSTKEIIEYVRRFDPVMDEKLIFFRKGPINGEDAREVYDYMKPRSPNEDGTLKVRANFSA